MTSLPFPQPEYSGPVLRPRVGPAAAPRPGQPVSGKPTERILRLYASATEREAIERRIGDHTSIADLIRGILTGEYLLGANPKLPSRPPNTGTRTCLKVRIPIAHREQVDETARRHGATISDYVVRRLLALPERTPRARAAVKLSAGQRQTLQHQLVTKRLEKLTTIVAAQSASDELQTALRELTEAINQMNPERTRKS